MKKNTTRSNTKTGMIIICVIAIIFLVIMGSQIIKLNQKLTEREAQLQSLQEQYEEETERTAELEELSAYMQTDDYIREMAKTKLGLVYDSEIIFKEMETEE